MTPRRFETTVWILLVVVWAAGILAAAQSPRTPGAIPAQTPYATTPPAVALQIDPYEWHDADTVVNAVVRLPYGVLLEEDRGIRAIGYDAWEIGHRAGVVVTESERARGRAALAELRELSKGRTLWAEPEKRGSRDSFGRPLARFWLRDETGWIDVAQWARENGHTRR